MQRQPGSDASPLQSPWGLAARAVSGQSQVVWVRVWAGIRDVCACVGVGGGRGNGAGVGKGQLMQRRSTQVQQLPTKVRQPPPSPTPLLGLAHKQTQGAKSLCERCCTNLLGQHGGHGSHPVPLYRQIPWLGTHCVQQRGDGRRGAGGGQATSRPTPLPAVGRYAAGERRGPWPDTLARLSPSTSPWP
jgi:hypothetical protein